MDDAAQVAAMLNEVCSASLTALQTGTPELRRGMAAELRTFGAELEQDDPISRFLQVVARWLDGTPPDVVVLASLQGPFRRAVETMLLQLRDSEAPEAPVRQQAPDAPDENAADDDPVIMALTQLTSAVVMALRSGDLTAKQTLASHLITALGRLPADYRAEADPFLENLRLLLGGIAYDDLPTMGKEPYLSLWNSLGDLLTVPDVTESARAALLDRVTHNAIFALKSNDERLTNGLLDSLAEIRRLSGSLGEADFGLFLHAVEQLLRGQPTPLPENLPSEYQMAWEKIRRITRR